MIKKIKNYIIEKKAEMVFKKKTKEQADFLAKRKDNLCKFLDRMEIVLEFDHPMRSYQSDIQSYIKNNIETDYFNPKVELTFNLKYTHHYDDCWEKHNITERFAKIHQFRVEKGTMLHLAAILGDQKFINTVIEKGCDIKKKDILGKTAFDLLYFNENYNSKEEFENLKNKLNPNLLNLNKNLQI